MLEVEVGTVASNGRIWLNGTDISHWTTGVEMSAQVGEVTKVTVSLIPEEVRFRVRPGGSVTYVATGADGVTRKVRL